MPERSLGFARDDVAEVAFPPTYSLYGTWVIHPPYRHFQQSREIILALHLFLLPSQMDSPSLLSHIRRYTDVQERSLHFGPHDDTGIAFYKHIRCTLRGINPFPHTVMRSAARNLPSTLLFLVPFAKGFPFPAVSHRTLYQCARKIPRLRFR